MSSPGSTSLPGGDALLSVIVPARNCAAQLRRSLPALRASTLPRSSWELVVVDDASTDDTPMVAAEYADVVARLTDRARGPAAARNHGVEQSRGSILVFVDADVCVHARTLEQFASAFRADPGLAAVFGSYDAAPTAPGTVSQFRNLLHHYVHQRHAGPAETFWAGCGAIRREALLSVGMLAAQRYPRPQIEDIELGRRLRRAGHRIELRPEIQGTHLKRWTLTGMVVTDFRDRGIPWMRLLLEEGAGRGPATLNLKPRDQAATALVGIGSLAGAGAVMLREPRLLLAAAALAGGALALNLPFYRFLRDRHGAGFAARAFPLHLLFYFVSGCAAVAGMALHAVRPRTRPPAEPAVRERREVRS